MPPGPCSHPLHCHPQEQGPVLPALGSLVQSTGPAQRELCYIAVENLQYLPLEPSEGKCFGLTNCLAMPNFSAEVLGPREPQSWVHQDVGHPLWTQAWVLPGLVVQPRA